MTHSEQHRMVVELAYHAGRMNRDDLYEFEILQSRDNEDEDFDAIARETLLRLYDRYKPKKTKKDAEDLWKKLTSGGGPGSSQ